MLTPTGRRGRHARLPIPDATIPDVTVSDPDAQAVGEEGVARRIDVIAMAMQLSGTVYDLEEAELCYAPQFGAAKDPINLAGMIAANHLRGDLPHLRVLIPMNHDS